MFDNGLVSSRVIKEHDITRIKVLSQVSSTPAEIDVKDLHKL